MHKTGRKLGKKKHYKQAFSKLKNRYKNEYSIYPMKNAAQFIQYFFARYFHHYNNDL